MNSTHSLPSRAVIGGLALAAAAPSARANVFASNVKINGGITNLAVAPGTNVSISYILNEPASAGVTISILSGATAVRTINLAAGSAGTLRGTNLVVWNGKNDSNANVPGGTYAVSIKAASSGYAGWTKITDDNNVGNYVWEARGIAVDRNTNSPYYGRVFVGNSWDNSGGGTSLYYGDYLGIQKLNADGSYADEGGFSDGGVDWPGQGYAPWKIRVSDDDYVYVEDAYSAGDIYRFDGSISSASRLHAFAAPQDYSLGSFTGFCLTGNGTNTWLWAADNNSPGSLGIEKFPVQAGGTFNVTNSTQVVGVSSFPGLNWPPWAVTVDRAGAIYPVQQTTDQTQAGSLAWAFRFPAYDPATNGGAPEFTSDWVMGGRNDYCGGYGIAADATGTYVAAAFWGYYDLGSGNYLAGNLKILRAVDGTVVTNLDLGVTYTNDWTSNPTLHADTDADWDAVGNVYYLDDVGSCWRAFSPPGTNQATTVALATIQVTGSVQAPHITSIGVSNRMVIIHFTGGVSDVPASFVLLSASVAAGPYPTAAGATITGGSGSFQAMVPTNGPMQFYRIMRLGTVPLQLTRLTVASGMVIIKFTSAPGDSPSAFTLLSSAAAKGTYSTAAGASIIQLSPGVFQATVPTNGPSQFYQLRK